MNNPLVTIHNSETGETIKRVQTAAEFKSYEAMQAADEADRAALVTNSIAKAALLARLGISADEAKLLL